MGTALTRAVATAAACAALVGTVVVGQAAAAPAGPAAEPCALPSGSGGPERSTPEAQQLDPAAVRDAIAYAQTNMRLSVRIHRHNCLVGTGPLDPVTENVPMNVWSSTKSVVSMATGIAYGQGRLGLDDPIGAYLPDGPGWGDDAHRAITVRNLLQEAGGLDEAILSEAATVGNDPHVARQALALPITHEPGTNFAYSQRTPDLLAFVVARAVGQDFQDFVQDTLFDPIGIDRDSYVWLRDRSGNTYGYAHLFMPSEQFARLGLLMQNGGAWNGRQVVPADYVRQVSEPSVPNPCYGLLFWTNRGDTCTTPDLPASRVLDHESTQSAPRDMYAMVGALHQNNFIVPSLDMTITWNGVLGDKSPDPQALLSASPADLYYNFFRILMRGVEDQDVPDPGPYRPDTPSTDLSPDNYLDPAVLGNGLGVGPYAPPGCSVVACPPADAADPRDD
ncbi:MULTISPECIES: serine hydrolase [unclassified Pseudonocardia]|uniref:serine hydrolase domain-containing protein n=1 Tax=unclassified Pseudonocardia TaxID=2619320 RepID=UPI0001FFEBE5|nr:serine hydrolase [Pseudonocardia sp. Ae707_Ps1]OLM19750.1 Beta-lactamase [Pseudonocardia sp. Ae707_Ps1]